MKDCLVEVFGEEVYNKIVKMVELKSDNYVD
jgi:hypothetical protein